ncbi:MAG: family 10 glycosylhydrolase [Bacteroidales bacterium]|nr:family 10 glycosylhydrolase [Bacteroidales bacterium]
MKHYYLLALAVFAALLYSCGTVNPDKIETPSVSSKKFDPSKNAIEFDTEFRAAWVATVANIDWPTKGASESQQKSELRTLLRDVKAAGCNAIMLQVVSNADAIYPSELLPWSVLLTGKQGQDPGYDPLGFAVEEAHELGLEIHAWVNPLRIGSVNAERVSDHPMKTNPSWYQTYKNNYYWNPGLPQVREFLGRIVTEIVTNYDVDGVHIDDYFYPSGLKSDSDTWYDTNLYNLYADGRSLDEWRFSNIDEMIRIYQKVTHEAKPSAVFGVSPAGRIELTANLYADPRHWVEEGTIDYLTPQIYWDHNRGDFADFDTVLPQWLDIHGNIPLMPGLASYKYGTKNTKENFTDISEYLYQVNLCRKSGCPGNFWYNTTSIRKSEVKKYLGSSIYPEEVLTPSLSKTPKELTAPSVLVEGTKISWSEVQGADNYVVFKLTESSSASTVWKASIVKSGTFLSFEGVKGTNYIVLARSGAARSGYSQPVFLE